MSTDIPDISLALYAIEQEGRDPLIVPHWWWVRFAVPDRDYLVLQDATFRALCEERGLDLALVDEWEQAIERGQW